jgi:prophage regulatory protein
MLLRMSALTKKLGISRSSVYRLIDAGDFPQPVRLTPTTIAWRLTDVEKWVEERPATKEVTNADASA